MAQVGGAEVLHLRFIGARKLIVLTKLQKFAEAGVVVGEHCRHADRERDGGGESAPPPRGPVARAPAQVPERREEHAGAEQASRPRADREAEAQAGQSHRQYRPPTVQGRINRRKREHRERITGGNRQFPNQGSALKGEDVSAEAEHQNARRPGPSRAARKVASAHR
jgi:hypothetical protein